VDRLRTTAVYLENVAIQIINAHCLSISYEYVVIIGLVTMEGENPTLMETLSHF